MCVAEEPDDAPQITLCPSGPDDPILDEPCQFSVYPCVVLDSQRATVSQCPREWHFTCEQGVWRSDYECFGLSLEAGSAMPIGDAAPEHTDAGDASVSNPAAALDAATESDSGN